MAVAEQRSGTDGQGLGPITLTETVLRRLSAYAALSPEEASAVCALRVRDAVPGAELVAEGAAARSGFLVSGWACQQRLLDDGRRQIVGFVLPGDPLVPLLRPEDEPAGCATVALTRVQAADAAPLRAMLDQAGPGQHRGLRAACAAAERAERERLVEHVVSLGRRTAYERLCCLLAELRQRLAAVGLADGSRFPLPLTQEVLADALGLSVVHVNRTLQQARRDGALEVRAGWARLLRQDGALAGG